EMIKKAKRPILFVGGGAILAEASKEITEFAQKLNIPVADTLMGKGAYPGTEDTYLGMVGMHGAKYCNLAVAHCDLLITAGSRFSDRVTSNTKKFANKAKILQIDVDPAEVNKNVLVDHSVIGDLKEVFRRLNSMLEKKEYPEWREHILELKEKYPLKYSGEGLTGPFIVEEIYRATGGDAIISTEVGQHQMWASQYFHYTKPRTFLTSGGLGTMGYGLGASIGAKVACPDKTVINIAGDGCFRMNMNEIATATRYNIPIIQVVVNNHVLGMVRQWQNLFYEERYSYTVLQDKVDFVKLAEAMGAVGIRVTKRQELSEALKKAIEMKVPVVIDCIIDRDEKVFPMVPAGAAIDEAFDEDDLKKKN
ncbi:MAG TPA: thiamine pyrophosphate-dependent enzyme, partial [Lachnospiraceae bacterium]